MANVKLSEISAAGSPPASTDAVVGVTSGTVDNLFTLSQVFSSMGSQGAALTKVNDTNVTLTLGGTPATSLLKATSLTLGWTGTLDLSRFAQGTDGQIIVGQTSAASIYATMSGDATLSSVGALTIGSAKITYAKFVNGAGLSFVGRSASSAGVQADIVGTANQIPIVNNAGTALAFTDVSGDLTNVTGAFTIGAAKVTYAKIANGTGLSLIGRSASSAGVNADLVGTANQIPVVNNAGTSLAFVSVSGDLTNVTGAFTIAAAAVTYAKIVNGTGLSVIGRSANSGGVNADIVGTLGQVLRVGAGPVVGFGSIDLTAAAALSGALLAANGGTGVANNAASTITISGNFGTTFTVTGTTSVTLPTSGTLVNTGVTSLSSLTTVGTLVGGATGAGFTVALGTSTITGILGSANGGTANGFTKFSGPASAEKTFTLPNSSQTVAMLDLASQTLSGGATVTVFDNGTKSSGTFTVDCGKCPLQKCVNGGAFTLAAPAADGSCILLITNSSAGAITFSGFTGTNTGDTIDATGTNKFSVFIWRVNSISGYRVASHQ